jgi:GxxExxY protein
MNRASVIGRPWSEASFSATSAASCSRNSVSGCTADLVLLSHLPGMADQSVEMHPNFSRAAGLTSAIIGAAIEVHRDKGPGLIESIYQWCLEIELGLNKLAFVSQKLVTVSYKGFSKEEPLRFDVLVEGCVLVEAKAVVEVLPIHKAQLLSYLKLMNVPIGLLINFHALRLADGVHRLVLPGADR